MLLQLWAFDWTAFTRALTPPASGANYHATYKQYPSPDFDGRSWRIRCLPFLFASVMYEEYRFDQPWNSPLNITLDTRPLFSKKVAADGSSGEPPMEVHGSPYTYSCRYDLQGHGTSYLMLVGEDAFGKPNGWRREDEITDGLDSTLAFAETARKDIHWLSPTDFDITTMSFAVNDGPGSISSAHPCGPAVLFCDGNVFRLNPAIPKEALRALVTINGGEGVDRGQLVRAGLLVLP